MLRGELVGLRARHEADVAILHAELYENVEGRSRSSLRPWVPMPLAVSSRFSVAVPEDREAVFSVVELSDGELAGDASLWGIDNHNRSAHLGLSLRPSFRGRGLGTDIVRVLSTYGFITRGLHRLQVETLADNGAMIGAATQVGYQVEGRTRRSGWVNGEFVDDVILGLLTDEFSAKPSGDH